jgi:hypothetical protein
MEGWPKYASVARTRSWARSLFAGMREKCRSPSTVNDGVQRQPGPQILARKEPLGASGDDGRVDDFALPEGLRRPRKGPLNKHTGRRPNRRSELRR